MIKNIVFDFGGVIFELETERAIDRFGQIGLPDASQRLDKYQQRGIFAELETGKITMEVFQQKLETLCCKRLTEEEIRWAWMGYVGDVATAKMEYIASLRQRGYKVYLLSNINPYIMKWAYSKEFCLLQKPVTAFFEKLYLSYEIGALKPDPQIFSFMLEDSGMKPEETLFVDDGAKNTAMAEQLGIHAFLSVNKEPWMNDVENLLH